VRFAGGQCTVVDGPFSETNELIAGFWLFQTESLQQAIDWVKRCPASAIGDSEMEIRQLFEPEDFGAELTPELREQEQRLRAQLTRCRRTTVKISTYLTFDGHAREAFAFYQQVLGGELATMTFADSPDAEQFPAEHRDRIMHACLTLGEQCLMASDTLPGDV